MADFGLKICAPAKFFVTLPLQRRCNGDCGLRLSEGQASLPPRSPCSAVVIVNQKYS